MSMHGIGSIPPTPWPAPPAAPAAPAELGRRPHDPAETAQPELARSSAALVEAARASQPEEVRSPDSPPEGVDAELWSLLTTEERAHFGRFAAMGGVTYGRHTGQPSRPPMSGQRLDLKV